MNGDGQLMVGTLCSPAGSDTLAIIVHGFMAHRDQSLLRTVAKRLSRAGIASYRFDFSGNGDSEGRFEDSTPSVMLRELDTVISHFGKRYAKTFLVGHCLGGTLSLLMASRRSSGIRGIALIAAPMRLDNAVGRMLTPQQREQVDAVGFTVVHLRRPVGEIPYTVTEAFVRETLSLSPLSLAQDVRCQALLVHGTADAFVPQSDSEELFARLADRELFLVGGADHNMTVPEHQDAAAKKIAEWMKKRL